MCSNMQPKLFVRSPQADDEILLDYGKHRMSCGYSPSLAAFHPSSPNWIPQYDVVAPVIGKYPEVKDLPWLSFYLNKTSLEQVPSDTPIADFNYMGMKLERNFDVLCCSLRLNTQRLTLVFDGQDQATASALGRWLANGYIPMLLQDDEHSKFVRLPIDTHAATLIQEMPCNPGGFDISRLSAVLNVLCQWARLRPSDSSEPHMLTAVVPSAYVVEAIHMIEDSPVYEFFHNGWF